MKALEKVMKKWNRQSPIVFLLTVILGISALLIPIFGAIEILEKSKKPDFVLFELKTEDLCKNPT
jgi:hypothetical protein